MHALLLPRLMLIHIRLTAVFPCTHPLFAISLFLPHVPATSSSCSIFSFRGLAPCLDPLYCPPFFFDYRNKCEYIINLKSPFRLTQITVCYAAIPSYLQCFYSPFANNT